MLDHGAQARFHASRWYKFRRRPRLGYRFGLRASAHPKQAHTNIHQEDLMASRRPTEPPRTPEVIKEIPKVIKADEKVAPAAPSRTRAKAPAPRVRKPVAKTQARVTISEDVRRGMIAEGAYLRAERRGFAPGYEDEDWLAAEAEVDALLKARHGGTSQ
jgi:hypothetical protein